jgi:hypothetical protein
MLAGMPPRDIAWQEKAFDEILAQTGGWKVEAMNAPDIHDWVLLYLIRLGHKNLNLVFGGSYDGCFGLLGAPDYGTSNTEEAAQFKKEWEKRGAVVEAGGDCMMGPIGGQGGMVPHRLNHDADSRAEAGSMGEAGKWSGGSAVHTHLWRRCFFWCLSNRLLLLRQMPRSPRHC